MNDPAKLTDATLKRQLIGHLIQKLRMGDYDGIRDWVPDSLQGKIELDILHRNRTTTRIRAIISEQEGKIVNYLISLIGGFLLSSHEKNYLFRNELSGRESVNYPIYSLAESHECLTQFVIEKEIHYRENFVTLVNAKLGQGIYADMCQRHNIDIAQDKPPVLLFQADPVPPVWKAYTPSPKIYTDRTWLSKQPRDKTISVMSDSTRDSAAIGSYFDFNKDRETAFQQVSDDLAERKQRVLKNLEKQQQSLDKSLAGEFETYNLKGTISQEAKAKWLSLCSKIAELQAESTYLLRYESLHKMQKETTLDKLITLIRKSGPGKEIPVRKMGELRDHIEFLIQNLKLYFEEVMKDLLLRSNIVSMEGEPTPMTESEKKELGAAIAKYIEAKQGLNKLFKLLREMNMAEIKRTMVEAQLRPVLQKLSEMQAELAHTIEKDEDANIEAERKLANCIDIGDGQKMRRRNKLVELAPGQINPDTVINFAQLLGLYQGTTVSQAYLRSLYELGFDDKSQLLHLATHYPEAVNREAFISHLLNEGARVDYQLDDVQVLAQVYDTIFRSEEGTEEQRQGWKLFSLLNGAKQLFESEQNCNWLAESATSILKAVKNISGAHLTDHYQIRDGALVENLVRRLVISVYLGLPDKETIQNSPIFQKLCSVWRYLDICIQTPQMFAGEIGSVKLSQLENSVLKAVLAVFKTQEYQAAKDARDRMLQDLPVGERISADDRVRYRTEIDGYTVRAQIRTATVAQGRFLIRNGVPLTVVKQMIYLMPGGRKAFLELENHPAEADDAPVMPADSPFRVHPVDVAVEDNQANADPNAETQIAGAGVIGVFSPANTGDKNKNQEEMLPVQSHDQSIAKANY